MGDLVKQKDCLEKLQAEPMANLKETSRLKGRQKS